MQSLLKDMDLDLDSASKQSNLGRKDLVGLKAKFATKNNNKLLQKEGLVSRSLHILYFISLFQKAFSLCISFRCDFFYTEHET